MCKLSGGIDCETTPHSTGNIIFDKLINGASNRFLDGLLNEVNAKKVDTIHYGISHKIVDRVILEIELLQSVLSNRQK